MRIHFLFVQNLIIIARDVPPSVVHCIMCYLELTLLSYGNIVLRWRDRPHQQCLSKIVNLYPEPNRYRAKSFLAVLLRLAKEERILFETHREFSYNG